MSVKLRGADLNDQMSAYQRELVRQFEDALAVAEADLAKAHELLSLSPGEWSLDGSVARFHIGTAQREVREAEAAVSQIATSSHADTVALFAELEDSFFHAGGKGSLTTVDEFMAPVMLPEGEAV